MKIVEVVIRDGSALEAENNTCADPSIPSPSSSQPAASTKSAPALQDPASTGPKNAAGHPRL